MKISHWYSQTKKADLAEKRAKSALFQARRARTIFGDQASRLLDSNSARLWSFAAGMFVGMASRFHGKHPVYSKLLKSTIGLGSLAKIAGDKSRRTELNDRT